MMQRTLSGTQGMPEEQGSATKVLSSTGSSSSMRKSASRVSFSDANEVVVVEPLPDHQNCSWYSAQEIHSFKQTSKELGCPNQRKDFVVSLLEIQREHKQYGIHDPKGLRQVSRVASRESLKQAIARANMILEGESGI